MGILLQNRNSKIYFWGASIIALVALITWGYLSFQNPTTTSSDVKILVNDGNIQSIDLTTGVNTLLPPSRIYISPREVIETSSQAHLHILIENKFEVKIFENSKWSYYKEGQQLYFIFYKGGFQKLDPISSPNIHFLIAKGASQFSTQKRLKPLRLHYSQTTKSLDPIPDVSGPPATDLNKTTLSPDSISQTLLLHKKEIEACQILSLRQLEKTKGKIIIAFQIKNTGTTENQKIMQTELGEKLSRCLLEVIKRIHFPKFEGTEIELQYPIYLE